jgi:hypothetical protein
MGWDEVKVRAGQEFHKRSDLLMHRLGVRNGAVPLTMLPLKSEAGRAGQFFFSPGEAEGRADLVRNNLPDAAAEILREADAICSHRFRLLGYDDLSFGDEIDWHLDPVHGKRAPLDPWFRIAFLDFAVVGDHKITWELNRHQHLVTLAKARLLSGDSKYVHELIAEWRSWSKANPYPLGINWGSTLEVAFRSLSWVWVDHLLSATAEYAEFRSELLPALAFHGRYIERYLSTYFSPNTHLLGEAVALFFLGTLYPQIPGAARWREKGWKTLLHEAGRQVRPDGVYFEQSLYYHVYALDFFLHARLLAERNGIEIPSAYDAVIGRMLEVVAALAQAGPAEGFGDDDGGRVWNPRRNRTEQMTDPLALRAAIYSRQFSAARLTEEAIWLCGEKAVVESARSNAIPQMRSVSFAKAFADGGLYVIADSLPFAQTMMVDAGPQGVARSGHGHADALSVHLTIDGRRWLVDSGSGVYVSQNPADRNQFRGTGGHNTLLVDGVDQAVADEPFSWTHIPTTRAENWIAGKNFTYFVGSHNGYARLADPVVHRRHVMKIAGGVWLIRDVALGQAEHELEIRWHFAPDLAVRQEGGTVEIATAGATPGGPESMLIVPEETAWTTEITETMLSPAYGALQPAPLVRSHARVMLPAEVATVLVARAGRLGRKEETFSESGLKTSVLKTRFTSSAQAAVQGYELDLDDGSHSFLFSRGDEAWSFGPWSSDAQVLYFRTEEEKPAQLVVIGGTRVAWQGQPLLLKEAGPTTFFEWRKGDALEDSSRGGFSVTPMFEQFVSNYGLHFISTDGSTHSSTHSSKQTSQQTTSPYVEKH